MAGKKDASIQVSGSGKQLQMQDEKTTSASLSKTVSLELIDLMKKVNENDVTPETVNAACNCASQINKILKLNFDMKKHGF